MRAVSIEFLTNFETAASKNLDWSKQPWTPLHRTVSGTRVDSDSISEKFLIREELNYFNMNGGSVKARPPLQGVVIETAGGANSGTIGSEPERMQMEQDHANKADLPGCQRHVNGEENVLTTYCSRERMHLEREQAGEVVASYVTNDGRPQSSKTLIRLKNIFSKCLPNMPKTYISRLVFDRRHRSVVIQRNNGKVLAGITYRPFHEKKFAEIAFCAVAQTLQVSGFGTRLMNWTKYYAREMDAMEYFLTYADNAAVGYFAKQGFTKFQSMPKERWHGYIKDYDGGTLMECYIHPTLPYNNIPAMVETQKSYLEEDVQEISKASVVYPGLDQWDERDGGVRVNLKDIPGVIEAGWTPESHDASHPTFQIMIDGNLMQSTAENMKKLQLRLLDAIAKEEISWPFLEPVNVAEVPNYLDLVKDPIDISTIRKSVEVGNKYITMDIFVADVLRIFKNAKTFNGQESMYYKYAHKLSGMFNQALSDSLVYDMH